LANSFWPDFFLLGDLRLPILRDNRRREESAAGVHWVAGGRGTQIFDYLRGVWQISGAVRSPKSR